jgi:Tol biopolymer transport system component
MLSGNRMYLPAMGAALLIALTVIVGCGGGGSSSGGAIAFATSRHGFSEIYTMNMSGGAQTRLTDNDANDDNPQFSPDGTKIVFESKRDDPADREIYVMNANGTNQTRLTTSLHDNDAAPSWSPDGTQIVFQSDSTGSDQIWIMDADGTGQTRISPGGYWDREPSFSPDGTKIVYSSNQWVDRDICTMNVDGTGRMVLTDDGDSGEDDYCPSYSPDGTKIVFASFRDGLTAEIYIMNANGTSQTRLTNNSVADWEPSFGQDGKIYFTSHRDGQDEIYVMNADGSGQTRLTVATAGSNWSPSEVN